MINHQNGKTNCDWSALNEGEVSVFSCERIKAGNELFHNYGHEAAIDVLSHYGFTLKGNISPMQFTIPELILGKFYEILFVSTIFDSYLQFTINNFFCISI